MRQKVLPDCQRDAELQLSTRIGSQDIEDVFVYSNTAGRGTERLEEGERWAAAVAVNAG